MKEAEFSVCEAFRKMTENSTSVLSRDDIGSLRCGNLADIIICDDDIRIDCVIANGAAYEFRG